MKYLEAYDHLLKRSREIQILQSTGALLGWDQQTGMPKRAAEYRAVQNAHLETLAHRLRVAPEVGDWIASCEDAGIAGGPREAANIREWRRDYDRAVKVPERLVSNLAHECSLGHGVWAEARSERDFARFAPALERIVRLVRESAEHIGYDDCPYDALLDIYEPEARTTRIAPLFDSLAGRQTEILLVGEEATRRAAPSLPDGPYPVAAQKAFNREILEAIGYRFDSGRVDTAAHPFCTTPGPHDVRLTTRYDESDFTSSLFGVLHEGGHGLYEQGLPADDFGLPSGSPASLGIHESQSRLWENHVGRNAAFWDHWLPVATGHFPQLAKTTPEEITRYVNRVGRSFIRVESDEVSYDLHIILRFRIESLLINDQLEVRDIPGVWNAMFRELFEMEVDHDANGCLQDVHWSGGAIGYFPTYTLGNLNASQLMVSAAKAMPGLQGQLRQADYAPLRDWLREHIHQWGRQLPPDALIEQATGSSTSPDHHITHLKTIPTCLNTATP